MHEICNDQGGLNQRKANENRQHEARLQSQVSEEGFYAGKNQEPKPNPEEQLLRTGLVRLYGSFMRGHRGLCTSSFQTDGHQVDHRKNEHPDKVDEVPVQAADLDVVGVELAAAKTKGDDAQINHANGNVEHM